MNRYNNTPVLFKTTLVSEYQTRFIFEEALPFLIATHLACAGGPGPAITARKAVRWEKVDIGIVGYTHGRGPQLFLHPKGNEVKVECTLIFEAEGLARAMIHHYSVTYSGN